MTQLFEKMSYHKAADYFLKKYYDSNPVDNIFFSYGFLSASVQEAKHIARSVGLKDMEYQDAIVAVWFRLVNLKDLCAETASLSAGLLHDFFNETDYPAEHRVIVEEAIRIDAENRYAETKVQKVVSDAIHSGLAGGNFLENIVLLKEEVNRLNNSDQPELHFLRYFMNLFLKKRYYTDYARENYAQQRERNFQLLEKRIYKLEFGRGGQGTTQGLDSRHPSLTIKETEDLFKIAFRNYNQLVSVADAKASLLINVNSIIISFMLAFILGRIERYAFLLWPAVLLLAVCVTTILLSILASRPQRNNVFTEKKTPSYQRFFFGSFDLIDPAFSQVGWEEYSSQLASMFRDSKEVVYAEIYKESFNVRKVLLSKFRYLSKAYWVFVVGLVLSIIAFVLAIHSSLPMR